MYHQQLVTIGYVHGPYALFDSWDIHIPELWDRNNSSPVYQDKINKATLISAILDVTVESGGDVVFEFEVNDTAVLRFDWTTLEYGTKTQTVNITAQMITGKNKFLAWLYKHYYFPLGRTATLTALLTITYSVDEPPPEPPTRPGIDIWTWLQQNWWIPVGVGAGVLVLLLVWPKSPIIIVSPQRAE